MLKFSGFLEIQFLDTVTKSGDIFVICITNHMAVGVIWGISPDLVFSNFKSTPSVRKGDFEIDKK